MKRVLVTGGAGFVGRPAIASLVARGFEVHAVGRTRPEGAHAFHAADLLDETQRRGAVREAGASHLLHLAWVTTPGRYWQAPDNLDWTAASLDLVRTFREAGGTRAVVAGTCAEYDWTGIAPLSSPRTRGYRIHTTRADVLGAFPPPSAGEGGPCVSRGRERGVTRTEEARPSCRAQPDPAPAHPSPDPLRGPPSPAEGGGKPRVCRPRCVNTVGTRGEGRDNHGPRVDPSSEVAEALSPHAGRGDATEIAEGRLAESAPCRPATLYGAAKDGLHRVLAAYTATAGLSLAWGRLFYLYGPGETPGRLVGDAARALLTGRRLATSEGRQRRDFLHVADAGAAFAALLDAPVEGPVNIGSGEAVPVRTILETVGALTGRPDLINFGARPLGSTEPACIEADIRRLMDEVGFLPRHGLNDGLSETVAAWRVALSNAASGP